MRLSTDLHTLKGVIVSVGLNLYELTVKAIAINGSDKELVGAGQVTQGVTVSRAIVNFYRSKVSVSGFLVSDFITTNVVQLKVGTIFTRCRNEPLNGNQLARGCA